MSRLNRRRLLAQAGGLALLPAFGSSAWGGDGTLRKCVGAHPANISNYAPQLVAIAQGYLKDEGLDFSLVVAGGGSKLREIVAADQADFGLGDTTHALQMTNRGRPAVVLMAVDERCVYANIVVRQHLYEEGIDNVAKLVAWRRPDGGKPIVAVSTLGGGQHAYASFILNRLGGSDAVSWIAGGVTHTMLGGLQTKKFDAIVAAPSWQFEAEDRGWGRTILDLKDRATADALFGGGLPATVFYARKSTIDTDPGKTQAYVNAMYRAMQWIKASPVDDLYALIGERYLGSLPIDIVKREIAYYKESFYYDGRVTPENYQNGSKVWFGGFSEIAPISYENAVTNRFIDAAQKKYGS